MAAATSIGERADRAAAAAAPAFLAMLAGTILELALPRGGTSLLDRTGAAMGATLVGWQLILVALVLGAAAAADALLRVRAATVAATAGLLSLQGLSLVALLLLRRNMAADQLKFLARESSRLFFVMAPAQVAGLLAVPLAAIGASVALLRLGASLERRGLARRSLAAVAAAAVIVVAGHAHLARGGDADRYHLHLTQNGLWLTALALHDPEVPFDAASPELDGAVRTGPPRTDVATWAAAATSEDGPRPNVLLVKIDSLRWDELAATGGDPRTLPVLDALAARGILFDRCYAPAAETAYSLPSLMTGQYPLRRATRDDHRDLSYPHAGLADLLVPLGYRAALVTAGDLEWQGMDRVLRSDAYQLYAQIHTSRELLASPPWRELDPAPATQLARLARGPDEYDGLAADVMAAWIAAEPARPFVAVLDLIAAHYPYRWPGKAPRERGSVAGAAPPPFAPWDPGVLTTFLYYPPRLAPIMRNAYRNALHASDAALGTVLDRIDRLGLGSRTIVLVSSDHGESFHEKGRVTHASALVEEQIRGPLVLAGPGVSAGRRGEPCSLVDALPTILGRLGLPAYAGFQGFDLLDPATPATRPIFVCMQSPIATAQAVIEGPLKLVDDQSGLQKQLFDVIADPAEAHDLATVRRQDAERLQRTLDDWRLAQLLYHARAGVAQRSFPPRYGAPVTGRDGGGGGAPTPGADSSSR